MIKILNNNVYKVIFTRKKGDKSVGLMLYASSEIELFNFIGMEIIEKGHILRKVSKINIDGVPYDLNLEENELYKKIKNNSLIKMEAKKVINHFLNLEDINSNLDYFAKNICNKIILKTKEYTFYLNWHKLPKHSCNASKSDVKYLIETGMFKVIKNKEEFLEDKEVLILKDCRVPILNMLTKYRYADDFDFKNNSYYKDLDMDFKSKISKMKVDLKAVKTIADEPLSYCDITISTKNLNKDLSNNLINALVEYHSEVREEIDYIWGRCIQF